MSNFITNLLLIKDQNITMEDKLDLINVDGQDTFVFHGTLSYEPKCCTNCGCIKEGNNIVKNGFTDPLKVTLLKMSECPTYLRLRKQRFKCRECNSKFCAETSFVKKHCSISKNLIFHIMKNLSKTLSFKDIAELSNVSVSTVVRVMKSCREAVEVKTHSNLPEHLCFDEIKSTKDSKNGMSFVFLDAKTHDFIDIVDGRTQHILKQYFMRYPRKVRKKVKTICIDIYPPYMNMIREMFPNAKIIHIRRHGIDVANSLYVRSVKRDKTLDQNLNAYVSKPWFWLYPKWFVRTNWSTVRCQTIEGGFSLWETYLAHAQQTVANIDNEVLELKFEDFLMSPASTLEMLSNFCELDTTSDLIKQVSKDVDASRAYAFRKNEKLQKYNSIFSDRLKVFNYD